MDAARRDTIALGWFLRNPPEPTAEAKKEFYRRDDYAVGFAGCLSPLSVATFYAYHNIHLYRSHIISLSDLVINLLMTPVAAFLGTVILGFICY